MKFSTDAERFEALLPYFPKSLRPLIQRAGAEMQFRMQEIRIRCQCPVEFRTGGIAAYMTEIGTLTQDEKQGRPVSKKELLEILPALCGYSVYSFEKQLSEGWITVAGGCRVGFCGSAPAHIQAFNFRIARELRGCGEHLYQQVFSKGLRGLLLLGVPGSGKTTLLRDLCRILGGQYHVALIDERGEIAASMQGVPQHEIGVLTDVFDGYGRAQAMETALRVMAPQVLICDEIGSESDAVALEHAMHSGVVPVASAHAGCLAEARCRPHLRPLLEMGVFQYAAVLEGISALGQLKSVEEIPL